MKTGLPKPMEIGLGTVKTQQSREPHKVCDSYPSPLSGQPEPKLHRHTSLSRRQSNLRSIQTRAGERKPFRPRLIIATLNRLELLQ